jgi:acetoin utilization protein AcuB
MLVCDIMTKHVVCVRMDDTLEAVREILSTRRIHHVVVLDEQQVVGIISDRDVLRNVSPFMGTNAERTLDTATLRKRVHQFMTRHPLTIGPATQVVDAAKVLLEKGISCLPVVDEEGHVAGIVSTRDLLRAAIRVGCYIDGRRESDTDGRCAA